MRIRAILEWDDESEAYSATCPELNFVSSFGETKQAAIANLKDAIQLMLEPIPDALLEITNSSEVVELAL
jgi:predicted RNase H-like HicB family nuclease